MFNGMMMAGSQAISKTIIISSDFLAGYNLITEEFGGVPPTLRADIVITVNAGIDINGMNLEGLVDTSTILLINNGNIYGSGGSGGTGDSQDTEPDF